MNKLLFLALILVFPVAIYAQEKEITGRIFHKVPDGHDEILPYAHVKIMTKSDSAIVCGGISDNDGTFSLRFVPHKSGIYILNVSYVGMQSYSKVLNGDSLKENVGIIRLIDGVNLGELTIIGHLPAIEQKGDTTVINSSVYKLAKGSYLEELIKRIPGLDYDKVSGTLKYNGKNISEININGENFFSGNAQIALKNLPVEFVGKIKIYNKDNEIERVTGVKMGHDNYVLDIQTPVEIDGAFMISGNVGYGSKEKKDVYLLGNYFRKNGDNASFVGKSTNLDLTTNCRDNVQNVLGLNVVKKAGKNLTINGDIMYNRNFIGSEANYSNEQYLSGGNQYNYSTSSDLINNHIFTANMGVRWNINSNTVLDFNGGYTSTFSNSLSVNKQGTLSEKSDVDIREPFGDWVNIDNDDKINESKSESLVKNRQGQYMINAHLTHLINRNRGSISLALQYFDGKNDNNLFTLSDVDFYQNRNAGIGRDSVSSQNRYNQNFSMNKNIGIGLYFSYLLSKRTRIQLAYGTKYSKQVDNREIYDLFKFKDLELDFGNLPKQYALGYIDSLSNYANSKTIGHEFSLRFNFSIAKWNITSGIVIEPEQRSIDQKQSMVMSDTASNSINWRPELIVSWQNQNNLLKLSYKGLTQQAALTDLINLIDNNNPLFIIRGNPMLKPTYHQSIKIEMQNAEKGFNLSWNLQQSFNSQVRSIVYDKEFGRQESIPMNVNGNWGTNLLINYYYWCNKIAQV